MQDDLYEAARKVLDENELSQRLLQQCLEMPLPGACEKEGR